MAEVLAVVIKISVFRDIALYSRLKVNQLHIVSQKIELFSGFMNLTEQWWIRELHSLAHFNFRRLKHKNYKILYTEKYCFVTSWKLKHLP
jgi:hypothetical protein